jgi:molybdate transport system ATP-binding protein
VLDLAIRKSRNGFTLDAAVTLRARSAALFGVSGAGKSTLLQCIAGLERPDAGHVRVDGTTLFDSIERIDVAPERREIAYVFQEGRLFPHLTVRANLEYGPRARRVALDSHAFDAIVELLGLTPLLARRPHSLSGGEQQRVAIGRAVLARPRLLLLDEPLASLDVARRADVLEYIRRLRDELKIAMLYVSHSAEEVTGLAEEVAVMDAGRIITSGAPRDVLLAADSARPLLSRAQSRALTARIAGHDEAMGLTLIEHARGRLKVPRVHLPAGAAVRLRVHARDVVIARNLPEGISIRNALAGEVRRITGIDRTYALVEIAVGDEQLEAHITHDAIRDLELATGDAVVALVKAGAVEIFDDSRATSG